MSASFSKISWSDSEAVTTASSMRSNVSASDATSREKVNGDRDQRIERKQLRSFEPVGLTVQGQIGHDRHRQADGDNLERREDEIERVSQRKRQQHEHGGDEQRDLHARLRDVFSARSIRSR